MRCYHFVFIGFFMNNKVNTGVFEFLEQRGAEDAYTGAG
jgi:hypothetical protein